MFTVVLLASTALAQDVDDTGLDPSLPIPTLKYDRPPPDFSHEVALQLGYGDVTYWKQEVGPWVNFGLRIGWGRNIPDHHQHRIGVTTVVFAEGPLPVHMSVGVDPQLTWDHIGENNLWIGAGIGGAAMYSSKDTGSLTEKRVTLAPSASVRLGWSQTWSRLGRRLFAGVEPRMRITNGNVGYGAALVIGSGKGY
ncbi:MAG: hypothetical protein KC656_03630 [Myxococcales bacterium]|nr:hypothetical protein [Myxococcales bacterium]